MEPEEFAASASIIDKIRDQISSIISAARAYELVEDDILRRNGEVKLIEKSLDEKERKLEEQRAFLEAREKELQEKVELIDKERRSFLVIDEEITRKLCEFDERSEVYAMKECFIEAKEADVRALQEDVDNRIEEIRALEKKMNVREKWLKQLSENLGLKDKEIRDRDKELESRISLLSTRELEIEKREKEITERVQELLSKKISLKDEELESRFRLLNERELEVENSKIEIKKRVQELELRDNEIVRREKEIELKRNRSEELVELKDKQLDKPCKRFEVELEVQRQLKEIELKATQFQKLLESKHKQFGKLHKKFAVKRLESQRQCKQTESMATWDNELLQKDEKKRLDEKGGEADEEEKRINETLIAGVTKESSPKQQNKRKRTQTDASVGSAVNASSAVAPRKLQVSSSSSWPKKIEDPMIKEPKREEKEVSMSSEPQSPMESLMVTDSGENLKLLLNECPPPLMLYDALKKTCDPAKHVLHIIKEECAFSSTDSKDRGQFALGRCTPLLEQLRKLSTPIEAELKEAAKEFAFEWRTNLEKKKVKSTEVECFLQFLASYGLASCFDGDQLLTLVDPDHWRKLAPDFCELLALEERIPSFIQNLIEKDERVKAVKYMYALNYWGNFSPVELLDEQLNYSLKKHTLLRNKTNRIQSKMLSMVNEKREVKEVEKCMADCGIGSDGLSSRVKLRIEHLEKLIEEVSHIYDNSNGGNQPHSHTPSSFARTHPQGGNKHPRLLGPSEFPAGSSIRHPGQLPRQHLPPNFVTAYLDPQPRYYSLSGDARHLPYNPFIAAPHTLHQRRL